ncbi:MAG: hypothetical protein ACK4F9_03720 [Brevinematia bacterium]
METIESLKLVLNPLFKEDIKNIEILNSFTSTQSEIFIIKLIELDLSFILLPLNEYQEPLELMNKDILEAMTLKKLEIGVYKKHFLPSKIISESPLLIIHFDNCIVISTLDFINKLLRPILGQTLSESNILSKKSGDLEKEISKLIDNMFFSISGIPWDLDEFFYFIDKVSLQFILSKLLQVSSEDEITTLVLTLRKSGNRIMKNISSRAWERIQLLSKEKEEFLKQNSKWIESAIFGFSIKINHILQEDDNMIPFSLKLREIRDSITRSFYMPRIKIETLSRAIYLMPKEKSITDLLKYTDRTSLAKALVGIERPLIEKLSLGLSEKGKKLLLDDINFFASTQKDYSREKIRFLNSIVKVLFEEEYKEELKTVSSMIDKIDNPKIYYSINLTDIGSFLLFLERINTKKTKELLNKFLAKTQGAIKTTAELFLNKLMKLTYIYGDTMIREKSKNFIEKLYFTVKTEELLF